jgi:hypothetical protein
VNLKLVHHPLRRYGDGDLRRPSPKPWSTGVKGSEFGAQIYGSLWVELILMTSLPAVNHFVA